MAKHYLWSWLTIHVRHRLSERQYAILWWEWKRMFWNKAHNAYRDWKAGGWYGGYAPAYNQDAHGTLSADWAALDVMLPIFKKTEPTVDVGSGRGRVLKWLLDHGHRKIVGVELNPKLAAASQRHFRHDPEVEIISGSILDHLRYEWRQFFLFNPFPPVVLDEFLTQLRHLHPEGGVKIVYYNSHMLNFQAALSKEDFEVHTAELLQCKANLRSVAVLILKPSVQWQRSDIPPGEPLEPHQSPTPPDSTDTPSS